MRAGRRSCRHHRARVGVTHVPVVGEDRAAEAVRVPGGEVERGHAATNGAVGLSVPVACAQVPAVGAVVVVAPVTSGPLVVVVPDDVRGFVLPGDRVTAFDDRGYELVFGDRPAEQVNWPLVDFDGGQL